MADHALKMDSAFKDLDVRVSRTLRETEGRLNDRISRADELQSAELRQNTLTVDRKYADVCVGLDNKLLNLGDSLGKRIDEVEAVGEAKNETMEKRLQTFEARFLKSIAVTEKVSIAPPKPHAHARSACNYGLKYFAEAVDPLLGPVFVSFLGVFVSFRGRGVAHRG